MGTATTVAEAVALQETGVDAVVAQGDQAGGHRGTFLAPVEESLVGTMTLVPQVVDAVSVPVVASGGIMDGRGIAAALALGEPTRYSSAPPSWRATRPVPVRRTAVAGADDDNPRSHRAAGSRRAYRDRRATGGVR